VHVGSADRALTHDPFPESVGRAAGFRNAAGRRNYMYTACTYIQLYT